MTEERPDKRPFGVTVIIIIQLFSMLAFVGDLFGLPLSDLPDLSPAWVYRDMNSVLVFGLPILLVQLVIIVGLWRLQRWAWFLIMVQLGIGLAIYIWAYFNGVALYIYMLLNIIIVFYLNQHEVQHVFGQKPKPQQETA